MTLELDQWPPATSPVVRSRRPHLLRLGLVELLVAAIGYIAYSLSTGAVYGHRALAFRNAARVIDFERSLGLLHERQIQSLVLPHQWLLQTFNAIYIWGHLPLLIAVAVWLFVCHRRGYRVIRNAILISGGIGLILFYGFPVAPPRLIPSLHIVDTAALIAPVYNAVEPKVFFNPYAAIPSMHIGWDLLIGLGLLWCSRSILLRWFGALLPLGMLLAVIVTGNHYVVDGLAGAVVGVAALAGALGIERLGIGYGLSGASLADEDA
ncbi:MAG: phosphatase PAP2 family protein [Dehalococcoidia bacterium]